MKNILRLFSSLVPKLRKTIGFQGLSRLSPPQVRPFRKSLCNISVSFPVFLLTVLPLPLFPLPDKKIRILTFGIRARPSLFNKEEAKAPAARKKALESIEANIRGGFKDWNTIKNGVRDDMRKFVFKSTRRSPIIMPIFLDI